MNATTRERVSAWLEEAHGAMGGESARRKDILLELETAIYDRLEERTQSGEEESQALEAVLASLGDAARVGESFLPGRPLVAPHHTRPFLANLSALFAAHFLVVVGATVAGRAIGIPLLRVEPIADPRNLLALFARALQTLLFDAGLVLVVFAFLPRLAGALQPRRASDGARRVELRRRLEGAFFLALVLVVVNFLRDRLLALYLPRAEGVGWVPLVGPGLLGNLLAFNLWIGASIARDLCYARFGERKGTLALDLAATGAGLFCLLRIVASDRLVDLAPAEAALGTAAADTLAALLNTAFSLLALVAASLLAARAVRRVSRLATLG